MLKIDNDINYELIINKEIKIYIWLKFLILKIMLKVC